MPSQLPASPNYTHFNGRSHHPQQPTGPQYMQRGHMQGMMGPQAMFGSAPVPQGMLGSGPGPQGMVAAGMGPQRGPLSSPGGQPGSMPQGLVHINGAVQAPMHYMGYYPTPYFAPQSAGDLTLQLASQSALQQALHAVTQSSAAQVMLLRMHVLSSNGFLTSNLC